MKPEPDSENPYASTTLPADAKPAKTPTLRPFAILVGWLTDIAFSVTISFVLGIVVGVVFAVQGVRSDRLQDLVNDMPSFQFAGLFLGCCGTLLGGYVAARMGKVLPILHALVLGVVSLVTGLVALLLFPDVQPLWVTISGMLLVLPAAWLGGYARSRQVAAKA